MPLAAVHCPLHHCVVDLASAVVEDAAAGSGLSQRSGIGCGSGCDIKVTFQDKICRVRSQGVGGGPLCDVQYSKQCLLPLPPR